MSDNRSTAIITTIAKVWTETNIVSLMQINCTVSVHCKSLFLMMRLRQGG